MARRFVVSLGLVLLATASHADNCEQIRGAIEAKIRNAGVSGFTLSVVASDARAAGRVVGSCALGTRKIVYVQAGAGQPASAPAKPATAREPILTECKDGSTSVGGDCRK